MKRILPALLIPLFMLGACLQVADQKEAADQLVEKFHQAMLNNDWQQASDYIHPEFFKQTAKESWISSMQSLVEKHGNIQSFKLQTMQKDPRFRGDFYIYIYSIKFADTSASETITVYRSVEDNSMTIQGHMIKTRQG